MLVEPLDLSQQTGYTPYAGIGSRQTPREICALMSKFALAMESLGYIVRSGGAEGADEAFEVVKKKNIEIFLPYPKYRGKTGMSFNLMNESKAFQIAEQFHPKWKTLSATAQLLIARNTFQVLGYNLNSPSKFIICWTENAQPIGGTSQAIRIADAYGIPVYNLGNNFIRTMVENKVEELEKQD